MNIAIIVDDIFYPYLKKELFSFFQHNKNNTNLYLIWNGKLDDDKRNEILKYKNDSISINIIEYNPANYKYIYTNTKNELNHETITDTTYIRLLLPEILPSIDKILYIDSDCFIRKNLEDLYNINIEDYLLAAVREFSILDLCTKWKPSQYIRDFFVNNNYFNAGILLLNLKKMRELNYIDVFYNFYKKMPSYMLFADQDILNYCCCNQVKFISPIYNYHITNTKTGNYGFDPYTFERYNNFHKTPYHSFDELENACYIWHMVGNKNMIKDKFHQFDWYFKEEL